MENLDTITDFTDYLCEKEEFMRKVGVLTGGEEDLLATYLKSFNEEDKKRDFSDLEKQGMDFLYLEEGIWESYIENPQYLAKKEADEVSYLWDFIIERFTEHSIKGTQYLPNPNGVSGTEQAIRMMAKERRFFRRILSKSLSDLVAKPEGNGVRRRFAKSPENEEAGYAFLAMRKEDGMNEDEYRKMRRELLYAMCLVYKYRFPELKIITGLATETSDCVSNNRYSEDVVSYQADELSEQEKEDAEYLSKEMGILDGKNTAWYNASDQEYPTS